MTNGAFPVPQETVEAGLLASINGDMERWLSLSAFSSEDFVSHREVLSFFQQYLPQYGGLPSSSQIRARFGESWQPPVGDFAYWFNEMKRYSLARQVLTVIREGYDKIGEPEEALSGILSKLSLIRAQQTNHIKATDAGALDRLAKFDLRTQMRDSFIGIRSGLKIIDDTKVGFTPGSMVGIIARTSVGKTWMLLRAGLLAWLDGYNVLCYSPELTASAIGNRLDVLVGQALGFPMEYNKVISGDPSVRDNLERVTTVMSQSQRWWTYDSVESRYPTVGEIAALTRQHKADIVLVDGVHLMTPESRGGQLWENITEFAYGLKGIATAYECVMVVTNQAVNTERGRRQDPDSTARGDNWHMPTLNDSAFGDSFPRACSDVITMVGETSSPFVNWYRLAKYRERGYDARPGRMGIVCDFAFGKMEDVGHMGYSPVAVVEEARRIVGR